MRMQVLQCHFLKDTYTYINVFVLLVASISSNIDYASSATGTCTSRAPHCDYRYLGELSTPSVEKGGT